MFNKVAETIYWNKKGYPVAHPSLREICPSSCLCTSVCTHPGKAPWHRTSPAELVTCKLSFLIQLIKAPQNSLLLSLSPLLHWRQRAGTWPPAIPQWDVLCMAGQMQLMWWFQILGNPAPRPLPREGLPTSVATETGFPLSLKVKVKKKKGTIGKTGKEEEGIPWTQN